MSITIVGLGAGDISQISYQAMAELNSGKEIYLRTENHPIISLLDICYKSFDSYYDKSDSFEIVYEEISRKVVELGEKNDIIYAVPGHPRVAEISVPLIEKYAREKNIEVKVIASMSFIDAIYTYLEFDPSDGFRLLDAFNVRRKDLDNEVNIIITQVYDRYIASDVKLKLMNYYDDEVEVWLVRSAGIKDLEYKSKIHLYELDNKENEFDHLTSLYIPKGGKKKFNDIYDLIEVTDVLRGENGCDWDKKQTHKSLTKYLIEEAYELVDAIKNDDIDGMIEELGDLMYHVVLHSRIGIESGYFDFDEVCDSSVNKMVDRHPHVFGDGDIQYDENAWDSNKMKEKGEEKVYEGMERIPIDLPALMRAYKIQSKASKVGFDWDNIDGALSKFKEEYFEFIDELEKNDMENAKREFGDLMFALVKIGRFLSIDSEEALNITNQKFISRFKYVEESLHNEGKNFGEASLEHLEKLWNNAKK